MSSIDYIDYKKNKLKSNASLTKPFKEYQSLDQNYELIPLKKTETRKAYFHLTGVSALSILSDYRRAFLIMIWLLHNLLYIAKAVPLPSMFLARKHIWILLRLMSRYRLINVSPSISHVRYSKIKMQYWVYEYFVRFVHWDKDCSFSLHFVC